MASILNWLKWPFLLLYGIYVWLVFAVLTLVVCFFLLVLPGLNARRSLTRGGAALAFTLCGLRIRTIDAGLLPNTPCVLVANHASYLDGMVMTAVLPARFQYVVKREMESVPFAGYLLKRIGTKFVDRASRTGTARDTRQIMKAARNKESIVFFPEGTFAFEPGLKRFRSGAFKVAAQNDLPVVPAVIRGTRSILPAHSWLAKPGSIEVQFMQPEHIGSTAQCANSLRDRCRSSILSKLDEPDLLADVAAE